MLFSTARKTSQSQQHLAQLELSCGELTNILNAVKASVAYIAFSPDGLIVDCNELFLDVTRYDRADVLGKHHRIFAMQATQAPRSMRSSGATAPQAYRCGEPSSV